MVEVKNYRNIAAELLGIFASALGHIAQERLIRIFARSAGYLQDNGRLCFNASLDYGLHLFHIVEVKRWNSIFAFDSFLKKLARINQTEFFI